MLVKAELKNARVPTWLAALALGVGGWAVAQEQAAPVPDKPAVEPEKPAAALAPVEAAIEAEEAESDISFQRTLDFDLTPEQKERVKKLLPNAYKKLSLRKPLHMVALGDSIVDMFGYDDNAQNWIKGYPAQFGEQLARQFFYTGGVRVIKPEKDKPDKLQPHRGVEITLRNLGRGGKLSIHAIQALSTYGMEVKPDIVMISFGINDSSTGLDLGVYARAFQDLVATVRAAGADVILLGPTAIVGNPPELELGRTRPYTDTLREVAEESGAFFVDLGDFASLVTVPEELREPATVFSAVVESYRRFFDHEQTVDFVHPRAALHEQLGRKIYRELIDGPRQMPWEIQTTGADLKDSGEFELGVELVNRSEQELNLTVLPLVTSTWKPLDATPELLLKPGEKRALKIHFGRREQAGANNPMPSHEPLLRLPILLNGGGLTRIEDLRAQLRPAVLLWKVETQFNIEGEFAPANLLANTSGKELSGTWQASWMGQKLSGDFKLAADEKKELPLRFKLPDHASSPFNQKSPMSVLVTLGGATLRFDRQVDLTRNFGLKNPVSMTPQLERKSPSLPELGARDQSVTLRADADKENFFLTFEIRGIDLKDDPGGGPSWISTINLDARSYGKRLNVGVTEPLRVSGGASDGAALVAPIAPWAFGTGYAAKFEEKHIKAVLSSGSEGARRVTVTLPRSYLYLHEWALGNGNSQLGINATFAIWQPGEEGKPGGFAQEHQFNLLFNRHRDDAEGCAVLELTEEPTQRWSAALY